MPNYRAVVTEVNEHVIEFFATSRDEADAIAWEMFEAGNAWMMNLNLDLEVTEED